MLFNFLTFIFLLFLNIKCKENNLEEDYLDTIPYLIINDSSTTYNTINKNKNLFFDNLETACLSEYTKSDNNRMIIFLLELLGFGGGHLYAKRYYCFGIKLTIYIFLLVLIFIYPVIVIFLNHKFLNSNYIINIISIIFFLTVLFIFILIIFDLVLLF